MGRIAVEENGARYFADWRRARRPAGITTSATIALSLPAWRTASPCSTPIAIPAASACWRPSAGATEGRLAGQFRACPEAGGGQRRGQQSLAPRKRQGRCVRGTGTAWRHRSEVFDMVVADPPPFVKSKKDLGAGRQGLSQAGAPGRRRHRAGRHFAAGLLLAQYSHRTLRRRMRRGHHARGPHGASLIRRRARPGSSGASDVARKRLSESAGVRIGLRGANSA